MANIILRIEVNSDAETEKLGDTSVSSVAKVNNVGIKPNANGKYETMPTKTDGIAGLSFATGFLKFDANEKLCNADGKIGFLQSEENPIELMWGATNDSGEYSVTLTFSNANNLDKIVIYGDKSADQFATEAILDGTKTIISDDNVWAIKFDYPASTHTIQFTKWNRPNYNACITLIHVMLRYLDLNKRYIKNLDTLSQSTPNAKEIIYGALTNTGRADITDIDGEIADYIDDGIIPQSNVPIEIFLNGNKVQSHIISDMDYKTNSKNFTIELNNKITSLNNNIQFGYPVEIPVDQPEFNLINSLYVDFADCLADAGLVSSIGYWEGDPLTWNWSDEVLAVGSEYIIYGNNEYGTINEYLQSIKNTKSYAKESSVLERINKICEISQLQFYFNDDGLPKLTNARPIINSISLSNCIYVQKSKQFSELIIPKILKNKYNFVSINAISILLKTIEPSGTYVTPSTSEPYNLYTLVSTGSMSSENEDTYNDLDIRIITKGQNTFFVGSLKPNYLKKNNLVGVKWSGLHSLRFSMGGTSALISDGYDDYDAFIDSLGGLIYPMKSGYKNISLTNEDFEFYFARPLTSPIEDLTISFYIAAKAFYGYYIDNKILEFGEGNIKIDIGKDNEFLQTETSYDGSNITELIANNILSDYADGVADGTITLCCSDLYTINGEKAKDFKNGEILQVGDLITFEQTPNRIFRVTGRNFIYEGQPLIELEFMEVKVAD